jgi:hypothetical protein
LRESFGTSSFFCSGPESEGTTGKNVSKSADARKGFMRELLNPKCARARKMINQFGVGS